MMKKYTLCLIFTSVFACSSFAGMVTQQQAQAVALNFFKATYPALTGHTTLAATLKYTRTQADNTVDFYVFDISPARGFVIVAADDIIAPILAYSNEGYFNAGFHAKGVESWINKTANNIRRAIQQRISAIPAVTNQWLAYEQGVNPETMKSAGVSPLVSTTWDQENEASAPPYLYNMFCPFNATDAQRCLTGCVATAQAQIMKFWNYPAQGVNSFSYADNISSGYSNNYGVLSSNFSAHTYRWQLMPDILDGTEHLPQDSAVDLLMYDCAVSVGMDFGDDNEDGSGANGLLDEELNEFGDSLSSQYALVNYFGYDPDTIKGIFRSDFNDTAWIAIIEHELNVGRPVLYEGDDASQGGHAWVCDGYDGSNKLHMNWGWSGADNGFFSINNLTTSGNFNPIDSDDALIGILPKHVIATGTKELSEKIDFNVYPNPAINEVIIHTENGVTPAVINFINVLGQTVISANINGQQCRVDISGLSAGIYLVRMLQGEKMAVKQLVITK